jgi:hypothetical protein
VYQDRKKTWTGSGFVRVSEGASLELVVDNIYKSGDYEIAIRYENGLSFEVWEDLRVSIVRQDGPPDYSGICSDYSPQDDDKVASLAASKFKSLSFSFLFFFFIRNFSPFNTKKKEEYF